MVPSLCASGAKGPVRTRISSLTSGGPSSGSFLIDRRSFDV